MLTVLTPMRAVAVAPAPGLAGVVAPCGAANSTPVGAAPAPDPVAASAHGPLIPCAADNPAASSPAAATAQILLRTSTSQLWTHWDAARPHSVARLP